MDRVCVGCGKIMTKMGERYELATMMVLHLCVKIVQEKWELKICFSIHSNKGKIWKNM